MDGLKTISTLVKLVSVALVLAAMGCTTAYVNIPGQAGDVAVNDPNKDGVIAVEIAALKAVIADRPFAGDGAGKAHKYLIKLPAGTNGESQGKVVTGLDENAAYGDGDADQSLAVYEIRQIRVRAAKGQVDVVRPSDAANPASVKQLVTVYLVWDLFEGWRAKRVHTWRLPVDSALEQSHQPEAAPESDAKPDSGTDKDAADKAAVDDSKPDSK